MLGKAPILSFVETESKEAADMVAEISAVAS